MKWNYDKRMSLAYISGPYSAETREGIEANIQRARKVAEKYWKLGFSVICPHSNTSHMDGVVPYEQFLQGDFEQIQRCDVLVVLPGWETSEGTKAEIACADYHGISIIWEPEGIVEQTLREQGHKKGLAAIMGKWPGDETDEEVRRALEEMS